MPFKPLVDSDTKPLSTACARKAINHNTFTSHLVVSELFSLVARQRHFKYWLSRLGVTDPDYDYYATRVHAIAQAKRQLRRVLMTMFTLHRDPSTSTITTTTTTTNKSC